MTTWRDHILRVTPYIPGEQPQGQDIIKLNTNENPYPPAPGVQAVLRSMDAETLRRYPDPDASRLVRALSERYDISADQIFVGVGSDDVLALAFLTFFSSEPDKGTGAMSYRDDHRDMTLHPSFCQADTRVIFPDVTYSFYKVWAALYGIPYEEVPLAEDFTLSLLNDYKPDKRTGAMSGPSDVKTALAERPDIAPVPLSGSDGACHLEPSLLAPPRGIVIANPNAPTGIAAPLQQIEAIVRDNPQCVVIVDEAYIDFGGESALPLIGRYDNLLVVQTFSKSRSMAGMRIGYAFGSKDLIRALNDVKFSVNSYTLNLPSILAGEAALQDEAYFRECVDRIKATRARTTEALTALGFTTLPSATNFLFTRPPGGYAREIFERLRERGIYVRYFDAPRTKDYLRITVGTDNEMDRLIEVLKKLI